MKPTDFPKTHEIRRVNDRIKHDAAGFIEEEESRFERQIEAAADRIAEHTHGLQIVWQCGPSSVGKTTTAACLRAALTARGVPSFVVSLDDFYLGKGIAPVLADGSLDYESPEALDLPLFETCLTELLQTGETHLPIYDFTAGSPAKDTRHLHIAGDAVVLFEGVHAFEPRLIKNITVPLGNPMKLFVNTTARFTDGGEVLLSRRDIRLARRLLRDERKRNSGFENTMTMWQQVLKGDDRYIFPYYKQADITVDTTLGYEPCVMGALLRARLHTLDGTRFEDTARRFDESFSRFETVSPSLVPKGSVLREFIGR